MSRQAGASEEFELDELQRGGKPGEQPLRVLHVDDDEAYREALAERFDDRGFEHVGADSAKAARELVAERGLDCVVLDYLLRDATGLDLLQEGLFGETPVVLLTGQGSESIAGEAIHAGVDDYYTKGGGAGRLDEVVDSVRRCARRYRQSRELERARRRYELVADVVTEAVFEWDVRNEVVTIEGAVPFGYELEGDAVDVDWLTDRLHPKDREHVRESYEAAFARGDERHTVEYRLRRADDVYADVRVTSRFQYEDGEPVLGVGALSDVSDQRAHQRELERQNERLDRFASVVSHDLRNPLSVAEGYFQLARETGNEEHFDKGEQALDRIGTLIDDLLELARSGQGVGELGPVLLSGVATEAWEDVAATGVQLRVVGDVTVEADRGRLRQLFENLLSNAVKHGRPDEGEDVSGFVITIGVLDDGQGFYVEDDGVGIPETLRDSIFETGVTGADDGTGFGLAIVQEIVASHGWEITAVESDDGGARFEITDVTFL